MKNLLTLAFLGVLSFAKAQTTTWYEVPTGTIKDLKTICFASENVGYIGGADSLLLKTTDGGKTWSELTYSGVIFTGGGTTIMKLDFVSEEIGYMTVGPYTGTFKTMDGGITWENMTMAGTMCYNQGLYFWDENNGLIGGAGCFIGEEIERIVGGVHSSATINSPSWMATDYVRDIDFLDANFGMGVSQSRFLRTTDGGATWDTISSGTTNYLTTIEIINDTLIYAGYEDLGAGFGLMVSHDSGFTWEYETEMATFYYPDYYDVAETENGNRYAAAGTYDWVTEGIVFENKGDGWWYYPVAHPMHGIASHTDSIVFVVGDSGLVVTNVNPAFLSYDQAIKNDFDIQLYPNPTTHQLIVQSTGDDKEGYFHIYSLNGQCVFAGTWLNNPLNVSHLPPGEYVLELKICETFIQKKFIKQ